MNHSQRGKSVPGLMCALLMDIFFLSAAAAAGKGVGVPCSPDALVALVDVVVLLESVPDVFVCCANPAGASISASAAIARTLTRLRISILLNMNSVPDSSRNDTRSIPFHL